MQRKIASLSKNCCNLKLQRLKKDMLFIFSAFF